MVKRFFYAVLLSFAASAANAQNVQLHYDFGRNIYPKEEPTKAKVTVSIEQDCPDKIGSWFYCIDLDMSRKFAEEAYVELSREFNLGFQSPLAAHIEYNGGLNNREGSFQHSGLLGLAWNIINNDNSSIYAIQLMYKHYFKSYEYTKSFPSFQLTGVWETNLANNAVTIAGYVDFYRELKDNGHGKLVMYGEPQFWYNFKPFKKDEKQRLSIGTEVRVSNNFVYNTYNGKTFFINPTLALKWQL